MLAPHSTIRPPIEDVDWEVLAGLLGVPEAPLVENFNRRKHFSLWLRDRVEMEWRSVAGCTSLDEMRRGSRKRQRARQAAIARIGRAFVRAIEPSTPSGRKVIESVGEYLQQVEAPQLGAPKRDDRCATFLKEVFSMAHILGGRASFNRKTGKGKVVDLLDKLRPIMPAGFIPQVPTSTLTPTIIERICAKTRRGKWGPAHAVGVMREIEAIREFQSKPAGEHVCHCGAPLTPDGRCLASF